MTLPRKGSRRISVDGVAYRWAVRDRPTYMQGIGLSHMRVAVERSDAPHCVLVLILPALRRDNWLLGPGYVATPADVARWISRALATGWVPQRGGGGFELRLHEGDLTPAHREGERLNRAVAEARR